MADLQLVKDGYNIAKKQVSGFRHRMTIAKTKKEGMGWLLYKSVKKVKRRKYRSGVGASSAAAGMMGSGWILGGTIAVLAGGAATVTIFGWLCLGVATVGALGMVAYKAGRWTYKKSKLKKCAPPGKQCLDLGVDVDHGTVQSLSGGYAHSCGLL